MVQSFSYSPSFYSLNEQTKEATLYLCNDSPTRSGWSLSKKSIDQGLPTVIGKPIGLGKGYRKGHFLKNPENYMDVGHFTSVENKDTYALGTVKIDDDTAWEKIKAGELSASSIVIDYFSHSCSKCGKPYPMTLDAKPCCEGAHEQVDSWVMKRVDFVETPDFPQGGVLGLAASLVKELGQSNHSIPLSVFAASYEGSQTIEKTTKNSMSEKKMSENTQVLTEIKTLADAVKTLQGSFNSFGTRLESLELEAKQAKAAAHNLLVEKVLAGRKTAGTIIDEALERNMLAASTDDALNNEYLLQKAAALKKQADNPSSGNDQQSNNQNNQGVKTISAALDEHRLKMGFPVKEVKA